MRREVVCKRSGLPAVRVEKELTNKAMKKVIIVAVLLLLMAAGCDSPNDNDYEARTNTLIKSCKDKGGVPNIEIGTGFRLDSYKGCDFPLPPKQ